MELLQAQAALGADAPPLYLELAYTDVSSIGLTCVSSFCIGEQAKTREQAKPYSDFSPHPFPLVHSRMLGMCAS